MTSLNYSIIKSELGYDSTKVRWQYIRCGFTTKGKDFSMFQSYYDDTASAITVNPVFTNTKFFKILIIITIMDLKKLL